MKFLNVYQVRMGYENRKITNLLNKINDQQPKVKKQKWIEVSDDAQGTYKVRTKIKFLTLTLKSSLCDYIIYIYFFISGMYVTGMQTQEIRKYHSKIVHDFLTAPAK